MSPLFVSDANFFIQAHRMHYPIDVVPGFWSKVIELAEKKIICSIDKVQAELYSGNDQLSNWCRSNLPKDFFEDTTSIIGHYAAVCAWANGMSNHYNLSALNEFLDADEADAWLVAYAQAKNLKIVTHETSEPQRKSKIKIPDACQTSGMCVNIIEMFRLLKERF
ncbi:DUF4411 family protein [Pedobacter faecalis]|uniref:DUF4411 family protein n=1 Tax=Pedobacter faecalis TaxID=3041495 RepID=UPI00254CFB7A|nr:DUF4411 family protein [Pedobacter sp. ELA7]